MLKVAIIGAGQIAEAHIGEVAKIEGAEVIALCDLLESPAQALAEKFDIPHTYSNAEQMLEELKPDVVHLTTPPTSHYALGSLCIEAGAHIYVEKPLTVTADETEKLLNLARENGKKFAWVQIEYFRVPSDRLIQQFKLDDSEIWCISIRFSLMI